MLYRFFKLDLIGRVHGPVDECYCEDDNVAVERAQRMSAKNCATIEIWKKEHCLGKVFRPVMSEPTLRVFPSPEQVPPIPEYERLRDAA